MDLAVDFPEASMVWVVDDNGATFLNHFMSFENNTYATYGDMFVSGNPWGVAYSDPIEHFTYPLAYQDSDSSNYSGTNVGLFDGESIWGTESYIVDGYGTLITPFGTYENVLRLTATTIDIQSITAIGSEVLTNSIQTSWFSPDYPIPVLVIRRVLGTDEDPTESITMSALASYTPLSTGLVDRDNHNTFEVYPNPASDQITVKVDGLNANSTLKIYAANGKLTKDVSLNGNENIDVSGLSAGLYIAVMLVDGKRYAQKPFSIVR